MCVFMASGGIGLFSSVSVYNGFGLRNKLRDGPLHNEKARGIFFSPPASIRRSRAKVRRQSFRRSQAVVATLKQTSRHREPLPFLLGSIGRE